MKLYDFVKCSLPLLAENEADDEYPYWFGGTCFLARYRGELYVVTAKHCLHDKTKDEARVQRRPDSATFLTLSALCTQNDQARHPDDLDHDDWAVFLAVTPADDGDALGPILDFDTMANATLPPKDGEVLVVRGYPKVTCEINYDAQAIRWRAWGGTGRYQGRPGWSAVCHTMVLDDVALIESIDGLSGSPVFLMKPRGENRYEAFFAGMALRGDRDARLLHFLDATIVRAAVVAAHGLR